MKRIISILTVLAVMFSLSAGCRRSDIKEHTIHVPEMGNDFCARLIVSSLENAYRPPPNEAPNAPGPVKVISVDMNARTVTVKYESLMMARKNLEFVVSDLGFTANGVPANKEAAAKLPEACGLKRAAAPYAAPADVTPKGAVPLVKIPVPGADS